MKWIHHARGYYYARDHGQYYYVVRLEVPGEPGRAVWVWGSSDADHFQAGRTVPTHWTREEAYRTATEARLWAERYADAEFMSSVGSRA